MRFLKFRLAVERQTSPSPSTPMWAPRQGPQPVYRRAAGPDKVRKHTGPDCFLQNSPGCGNNNRPHCNLFPFHDPCEPGKIGKTPVRAGTDKDLVKGQPGKILHGFYRVHPGETGRPAGRYRQDRTRSPGYTCRVPAPAAFRVTCRCKILHGHVIGIEHPGLCPGLHRKVAEREPVVHR